MIEIIGPHTHSTSSYGSLIPQEIIKIANENGCNVGICDYLVFL